MDREKARNILLNAIAVGQAIPTELQSWIVRKHIGRGKGAGTKIDVEIPETIGQSESEFLHGLEQKPPAAKIFAKEPQLEEKVELCSLNEAIERLARNGGWADLRLEGYLNVEGAQLLARDLDERRERLKLGHNKPISPRTIRKELLKELKINGIDVYIQQIMLPWQTYFVVREKLESDLQKPEEQRQHKGISGMLRLAYEINREMKTEAHLGHLYTAGSAIEKRDKVKLEWQMINLPYGVYAAIEQKVKAGGYEGIEGMLRLADEINREMKTEAHLGTLYTAGSAIEKRDKVKLEWQKIDLPYGVYAEARKLVLETPDLFSGKEGWKFLKERIAYPENDRSFFYAFNTMEAKELGWEL